MARELLSYRSVASMPVSNPNSAMRPRQQLLVEFIIQKSDPEPLSVEGWIGVTPIGTVWVAPIAGTVSLRTKMNTAVVTRPLPHSIQREGGVPKHLSAAV